MPETASTATLVAARAENLATTFVSLAFTNAETAHKHPTHALMARPCATDEVKARE